MSLLGSTKKGVTAQRSALLPNPSNGISQELIRAFTDVAKVQEFSTEFLRLAKFHDTRERIKGIEPFIETNRKCLIQGFTSILRFIDFNYPQNTYHYNAVVNAILQYQAEAAKLQNSMTKEDQLAFIAINKKVETTQANSLRQLLGACEKMNLWHTMLTAIQPEEQMPGNTAQTIRKKLLEEIGVVTGYLMQRLLNAQLPNRDYYLIYQILNEKFRWFEQLIEKYQNELLTLLTSHTRDGQVQPLPIENILITYKNAIIFRTAFCELASAEKLKSQALAFCKTLDPLHSKLASIGVQTTAFKVHLEEISRMVVDVKQHSWLHVFNAVNDYLTQHNSNTLDITARQQQAQALKEQVTKAQKEESVPAAWVQTSVVSLLKVIAKPIPASEAKSLLSLTLEVMKLVQYHPSLETRYVGPCLKSALKKVADELLSEVKAHAQTTPVSPLAESDSLPPAPTAATTVTVVTDSDTHEESCATLSHSVTALSTQMASITLNPTEPSKREAMQALVKQTHEEALANSSLESQQQHKAQLRTQKKGLAKERKALEKQLHAQREEVLAFQRQEQQKELAHKAQRQQDELKQLRVKEEAKLKEEKETIAKQHKAAMVKADKEHQIRLQKEKQRLATESQQQIEALKARFAKEHRAKQLANQAELETCAKDSSTRVAQASSALQVSHQQALIEIEKAHHDQHLAMMTRVQQLKRATDGFAPINTFVLPVEVAQDLLTLDNAGFEAYLRGGWVRDRLLRLPDNPRADIDIIVRCSPCTFRTLFPSSYVQNPLEPRQFSHGKVDFWCSEWDDLTKEPCDFTINTFICDLNGRVFDLRGYAAHLNSAFLHVVGDNTKNAFTADPIKMLRMLRLAPQVGKGIEANDTNAIIECADLMTSVKIGIYLKNIQQLFVNSYAYFHLEQLIQKDLLRYIFPGVVNPCILLKQFWEYKLNQFTQYPEYATHCHVLALFLLQPLVAKSVRSIDHNKIQESIDAFLTTYQGEKQLEAEKIRKTTLLLLTDQEMPNKQMTMGLITEYDYYVRAALEEQHRQAVLALAKEQRRTFVEPVGEPSPATTQLHSYQRARHYKPAKQPQTPVAKSPAPGGKH